MKRKLILVVVAAYLSCVVQATEPKKDVVAEPYPVLGGVGLALQSTNGRIVVANVLPESPAGKSGRFSVGDQLLSVEIAGRNVELQDKTVAEAATLMRGPGNSQLTLTAARNGAEFSVILRRAPLVLEGVPSATYREFVGKPAPDLVLTSLDTGVEQELSGLRGKIVVLDFWASWCPTCFTAVTKTQELTARNADWSDRVEFIAVTVDSDLNRAAEVIRENSWSSVNHMAVDPEELMSSVGIRVVPTTIILDANGRISTIAGSHSLNIEEEVKGMLNGSGKDDAEPFHGNAASGNPAISDDILRPGATVESLCFEELLQAPDNVRDVIANPNGKVVVLDFWATTCAPCIASFSHLEDLATALANDPIVFVAVTYESRQVVDRFLAKRSVPLSIALDTDESEIQRFGIRSVPTTVIIAADKTYLGSIHPSKLTVDVLKNVIAGTSDEGLFMDAMPTEDALPTGVSQSLRGFDVANTAQVMFRKTEHPGASTIAPRMIVPTTHAVTWINASFAKVAPWVFGVQSEHRLHYIDNCGELKIDLIANVPPGRAESAPNTSAIRDSFATDVWSEDKLCDSRRSRVRDES